MIKITIPECLKNADSVKKKVIINSDDTWAFTQKPEKNEKLLSASRRAAHDLFDLFTSSIIRQKTIFTR
jgi:hypothetical protein